MEAPQPKPLSERLTSEDIARELSGFVGTYLALWSVLETCLDDVLTVYLEVPDHRAAFVSTHVWDSLAISKRQSLLRKVMEGEGLIDANRDLLTRIDELRQFRNKVAHSFTAPWTMDDDEAMEEHGRHSLLVTKTTRPGQGAFEFVHVDQLDEMTRDLGYCTMRLVQLRAALLERSVARMYEEADAYSSGDGEGD